ncbi:GH25 family lysozyme [Nonomuraea sp. NPDC004580]|uniref:GH25 family lysozyme n=1 Tax=Nonomuraea sp. NPDC004580 TaxID=3154552 RepID=UPI0033B7F253
MPPPPFPGGTAFDWRAIVAGQKFISIKATTGECSVDPWFARDLAGARSVDLIRTAYHYFTAGQDGASQADHFLRVTRAQGLSWRNAYEPPPVLDLEECIRDGKRLQLAEVQKFLARVTQVSGVQPTIYTQK